ncbi:glycoside hydrolase family 3 N-terminal domain-containing protein [Microbacterium sp. ARD32]|uniref:glycoside hydrolase family 3 N-terminal domain-containing protein n=1 Tax=Microbacterium sp. ARD32 TaxID=2962577 RepID=UPI0028816FB3|nr:glycoside hydrolase family 3 N-terminal domain-containing protein [Microbacterium sp. ARD32]MDT0157422.1 glycoside hydrolase family 3 N-terminal domain-containing protein [Microbacterium sp. ARD32]
MRRAVWASVVAMLAASMLAGCAPSAAPTPTPTRATPTRVTPVPTPTPTADHVDDAVDAMSVEEQAASVVMGHVPRTDPAALRAFMTSGPGGADLGGFILMGANVGGDPAQVEAVTDALTVDPALPPLIAIDQEGGAVSRLPWDTLPAGRGLQADTPAQTRDVFAERAEMVAVTGINTNFGVIADVPMRPSSFISSRALGTDPESSAARVAAAVAGEQGIVFSTLKHFPGHGAAPGDSHHAIPTTPMTLAQWRDGDAKPFIAGVDAGAELLMFGHLAYTAVDSAPASLSPRWHAIARDELGFDGVMITDDLGMLSSSGVAAYRDPVANAVSALAAGNDMVLMVAGSTAKTAPAMAAGIAQAVQDGALTADRLRDAAEHVMALRMRVAALRQAQ